MTVAVAESSPGGAGAQEPEGAMTHFYHTLDEIFHQSAESEDTTSLDGSMITMNLCLPSGSPDFVKSSPGHRQQLLLAYNTDIGPALKRNINAWCQATGLPTSITVYVEDRVFKLHKYPLVSRSGYFKKRLAEDCKEVKLPRHYPGGPDVFELVVNFCYGSTILMDPSNVATLRCAAQFLDMSEEHGRGNLCERSDVYLTQVALQSWEDTMVVLLQCHQAALLLLPLAEQVRIVGRCVDALANLACLEVLDPAERRDRDAPGTTSNESQFWRDMSAAMAGRRRDKAAARDWWVQDLVCLPCHLFERVVAAMRRQGMQERQVSQVVMMYAERQILTCAGGGAAAAAGEEESKPAQEDLVAAVVRLLPLPQEEEGCAGALPVAFLFALLRRALASDPQSASAARLEALIASQLDCASVKDYLLPQPPQDESCEVVMRSMQQIVALFLAQHRSQQEGRSGSNANSSPGSSWRAVMKVAKVWDQYLAEIAHCATLTPATFSQLAETFPGSARLSHDLLYRAIHRYLTAHPNTTEEERSGICRMLNCQKLSQEVCAHAVQNELMPLRMLVQAMFLQQLHTRNTLCEHLHSVSGSAARIEAGAGHDGAAPASLLQPLGTASSSSSFRKHLQPSSSRGRGDQFQYDHKRHHQHQLAVGDHHRQAASLKADFEATYSRLRNLEEELARMRQNLDLAAASAAAVTAAAAAGPPQKMRDSVHGQRKDGLASGCLGNSSSGLVLKFSRSLHKLRFVGSGFFWKTRTNNNVVVEPSAANSSSCAATEAAAAAAASSSSLRSSSLRYFPPHPTGADLTSASSTSLRWTSPSSSLTTFDSHHQLITDAAAVPSPRPPPPRRRRSMSADMAFQ